VEAVRSNETARIHYASNESEIDTAFATMARRQPGALVVASDPFFYSRRGELASLAARHRIPAIYYLPGIAGGLMSYGNSLTDVFRLAGVYVGRILKGEKPGDLAVVQATKFELVINLQRPSSLCTSISHLPRDRRIAGYGGQCTLHGNKGVVGWVDAAASANEVEKPPWVVSTLPLTTSTRGPKISWPAKSPTRHLRPPATRSGGLITSYLHLRPRAVADAKAK
jgi:hypothetical protein